LISSGTLIKKNNSLLYYINCYIIVL